MNTCINQKPIVCKWAMWLKKVTLLPMVLQPDLGELALGRNVLVRLYVRGNGCNFEDSIVISERIARDDVFTSIHISKSYECVWRVIPKLGFNEEISRDIPNVGEESSAQFG